MSQTLLTFPAYRLALCLMSLYRLDRIEARRIAIRAQLLDAHRPSDLRAVVKN